MSLNILFLAAQYTTGQHWVSYWLGTEQATNWTNNATVQRCIFESQYLFELIHFNEHKRTIELALDNRLQFDKLGFEEVTVISKSIWNWALFFFHYIVTYLAKWRTCFQIVLLAKNVWLTWYRISEGKCCVFLIRVNTLVMIMQSWTRVCSHQICVCAWTLTLVMSFRNL